MNLLISWLILYLCSLPLSPENIAEQGLDVSSRVEEAMRKFPLQIQEVIDMCKTADV